MENRLHEVVEQVKTRAKQYKSDKRYRDAEYIFRRASCYHPFQSEVPTPLIGVDSMPSLISLYVSMGDYLAAEVAQQELLLLTLTEDLADESHLDQHSNSRNFQDLLSKFYKRVVCMEPEWGIYARLSIVYRTASLDISYLNANLFVEDLIPLDFGESTCSSLHIAAMKNATNLAHLLLPNGAEVNIQDARLKTPLHVAVERGNEDMVLLLLEGDASVAIIDIAGGTPLHAALLGNPEKEIVDLLIQYDSDIEYKNLLGQTPLCIAIRSNFPAIAQYLRQKGVLVESRFTSPDHEIFLFEAVRLGREWATTLLLDEGANLEARNSKWGNAIICGCRPILGDYCPNPA